MPRPVFYRGEIVSCGRVTGKVVELKRKSDGAPFVMVEILNGPQRGKRDWPDAGWVLGVGPNESQCPSCERRFKFQPGEDAFFCPRCGREDTLDAHRRSQNPDKPRSSWERKQLDRQRVEQSS